MLRSVEQAAVEAVETGVGSAVLADGVDTQRWIITVVAQTEVIDLKPALAVESTLTEFLAFSIDAVGAETYLGNAVFTHSKDHLHGVQ